VDSVSVLEMVSGRYAIQIHFISYLLNYSGCDAVQTISLLSLDWILLAL